MNTKQRMTEFQNEFNQHFTKNIQTVLTEQRDFHPVKVSLDAELEDLLLSYSSGGKRVRPFLLSYLSGKNLSNKNVLDAGLSIELFHLMALIHDDIMDQSSLRRGVPTIHRAIQKHSRENKRLGEDIAILLGDSFLVASLQVARSLPEDVFTDITTMMQRTNRGQYLDSFGMNEAYGTTDAAVIAARQQLKTAWYTFGTPALIALKLSDYELTQEEQDIIIKIFVDIGILYQIRDDILDCMTTDGKEPFGDIFENQTTWVTLKLKKKYPELFLQSLEAKNKRDTEALTEIFSQVDLMKAYGREYELRIESLEEIKPINQDLFEKTKEVLGLLKKIS